MRHEKKDPKGKREDQAAITRGGRNGSFKRWRQKRRRGTKGPTESERGWEQGEDLRLRGRGSIALAPFRGPTIQRQKLERKGNVFKGTFAKNLKKGGGKGEKRAYVAEGA